MDNHSGSPLVPLAEAARQMGIHRTTAYQQYKRKQADSATGTDFPIPVLKIGSLLKVNKSHLDTFLATGVYCPDDTTAT